MNFNRNLGDICSFLQASIAGELTRAEQEGFLRFHNKIDAFELANVVKFIKTYQNPHVELPDAMDVCGTGGSGIERINTSTIGAFILSALDVKVAKHGNKASGGRFGSFDLLNELGVNFELDTLKIRELFNRHSLAFLFAPNFHNVLKHFSEVRKTIKSPTFFNLIGPLLNPSNTDTQLIGTGIKGSLEILAETTRILGIKKAYIVQGSDGLDEVTITGKTFVVEANAGGTTGFSVSPEDFGIKTALLDEICCTQRDNTHIAISILNGTCKTRHRDLVLANVALSLKLIGRVNDLTEGFRLGLKAINSGAAYEKYLEFTANTQNKSDILNKIVLNKRAEIISRKVKLPLEELQNKLKPSDRDFKKAINFKFTRKSLIAEIKRFSPNQKIPSPYKLPTNILARLYENCHVNAISVLTDKKYFGGDLEDLKLAANSTKRVPILCKDFIIDPYQIYEARKYGANAILLIVELLTKTNLLRFIQIAKELNMDCLCEIRNKKDLKLALAVGAEIVGINNRNLRTQTIDLNQTNKLCELIPPNVCTVSESGFTNYDEIKSLPNKVSAILVGSSIMHSINIPTKIRELQGKKYKILKICGVRSQNDLDLVNNEKIDLAGINFVPTSKRFVPVNKAKKLFKKVIAPSLTGIFADQPLDEVNKIAKELDLDYIQLHGNESVNYVKNCCRPVIKKVDFCSKLTTDYLAHSAFLLIDGPKPGFGIHADRTKLRYANYPFLLAGGISAEVMPQLKKFKKLLGVDVATGSESSGVKDLAKINNLIDSLTTNK